MALPQKSSSTIMTFFFFFENYFKKTNVIEKPRLKRFFFGHFIFSKFCLQVTFAYIPDHVQFMVQELLKNALRATVFFSLKTNKKMCPAQFFNKKLMFF